MKIFQPYKLKENINLYRLGNPNGDGGYIVADIPSDILYSYGVGDNTSFEEDYISKTGNPAHGYDHTITFNNNIQYYTYHKQGLSGRATHNTDNYINHLIINGDDNKNVLLKIDVEGSEYDWLDHTDISKLALTVNQLVIEFHNVFGNNIDRYIMQLNSHYRIIHWHNNNFGGVYDNIPSVLEITFLRKEYCKEETLKVKYPLDIDVSNNGKVDTYSYIYS